MIEIEHKIKDYINKNGDDISTPVRAYITF
jgi:hypothetical protein